MPMQTRYLARIPRHVLVWECLGRAETFRETSTEKCAEEWMLITLLRGCTLLNGATYLQGFQLMRICRTFVTDCACKETRCCPFIPIHRRQYQGYKTNCTKCCIMTWVAALGSYCALQKQFMCSRRCALKRLWYCSLGLSKIDVTSAKIDVNNA